MKKLFPSLAVAGAFVAGTNMVSAKVAAAALLVQDAAPEAEKGFTQILKEQFIQGGAGFMGIVLLCLILGLAVALSVSYI